MRADRLVSILLLLQANRRMTARVLSKRLECSERTILRDMDALGAAGVPVIAERGAGGGWSLLDGYQTKLNGLTAAEIQSLFLARPPQLLADLGMHEAAEGAWLKLRAALPSAVRAQAEFVRQRILIDSRRWRESGESFASLPVLLESLWRGRQLRFAYEKNGAAPSERVVDPLGLVARGTAWYLVADRQDERRTYRVSRIHDATVLDEPSRRPAVFDLAEHWEQASKAFRDQLPRFYATFLVEPSVMVWVGYRRWRVEHEAVEGDRVRIRLRFAVEDEALQFALAFGAAVEVVEPAALRERVIATARAIVAAYTASAAGADSLLVAAAAGQN